MVLLLAVAAVAAVNIYRILGDYKEADNVYSDLQDKFVSTTPQTESEVESDSGVTLPESSVSVSEETEVPKAPISVDFDALLSENGDAVGWIYSEGTPVNYPVLQAEDNDKYLRADLYGNWLISGTVFVDYRCGEVGENKNYIIYGHNMDNGTMFGSFLDYRDQAYYEAHPTIDYLTPSGYHKIELVAGLVVNKTDVIYYPDPFKEDLDAYLAEALENSVFDSGLDFGEDDRLVILSTCSYEHDNARFVLIGRLAGG